MAESAGVVALSHTHEAVMNWMLMNPDKSLRECADHFGYTQSWLSTLIHSDIFQVKLAERQEGIRTRIADSIPQKLRMAADVGIEKLATKLEESEDADFILDATDKLLHRLGYAPARSAGTPIAQAGGAGSVQNNFFISAGDLEAARTAGLAIIDKNVSPAKVIEGEVLPGGSE